MQEKKDKRVQLSPVVTVGPSDAVLERPITIRIPHCLPYRNNSWHLQMLGRALGEEGGSGEGGEWCEIVNTIGLVQLPTKGNSNKFHKKSAYQMHLDYVQVKTSRLGSFKLVSFGLESKKSIKQLRPKEFDMSPSGNTVLLPKL